MGTAPKHYLSKEMASLGNVLFAGHSLLREKGKEQTKVGSQGVTDLRFC